jgi:hypothetical protein
MLKTGGLRVYLYYPGWVQGKKNRPAIRRDGEFSYKLQSMVNAETAMPVFAVLFSECKPGCKSDGSRFKIDIAYNIQFRLPVE